MEAHPVCRAMKNTMAAKNPDLAVDIFLYFIVSISKTF
jgi:hypothetical protein